MRLLTTVSAMILLLTGMCRRLSGAEIDGASGLATVGSLVATNQTPNPREIGANYFESLKQSQIWINVEPALTEGGPPPVILNLTIAFPGVRLNHPPTTITVRAQPRCFPAVFHERVRQPILSFLLDGSAVDLTAIGAPYQWVTSCSRSSWDTVIAQVPLILVRQIAESMNVTVHALGFELHFTADDRAAWRLFIRTVENGATVLRQ